MSLRLPELNALTLNVGGLCIRAYRLRCKADAAAERGAGKRAFMLKTMSDAYMSYGLAQSHEDFGVESEKVEELRQGGVRKLQQARAIAKIGT
jgi:hypothetical protein